MYLVLLAGSLAVLCKCFQGLNDEVDIWFIDVQAQQAQATRRTTTHDVQELKCLTHKVVVGFVILTTQEVLETQSHKLEPYIFCMCAHMKKMLGQTALLPVLASNRRC